MIKYFGWLIPIILILLSFTILQGLIRNERFLINLIRFTRLGKKYSADRERIFALRKKIRYAIDNPYANNGASRATYEALFEEFVSILLRQNFVLTEQSLTLAKKQKSDFLTKKMLDILIRKSRAQESSLFNVAYPVMLRELKDVLDSYARALAYDKTATHL
jgi:hypothetical protein